MKFLSPPHQEKKWLKQVEGPRRPGDLQGTQARHFFYSGRRPVFTGGDYAGAFRLVGRRGALVSQAHLLVTKLSGLAVKWVRRVLADGTDNRSFDIEQDIILR